ncbi:DUF4189 domain-containing protein [Paraburkholderia sediminicola]|uniref:DUF4189 domain-containing protein n=1 Tax=Paraburkholderia sediminicola TaxID=458836 RepID=UPI0038B8A63B
MFLKLLTSLLAALALSVSVPANAWIVAAGGDNGYVHVIRDAASAEEAATTALVECGKMTTGCALFGRPVQGPVALAMVRADGAETVATNADPSLAAASAMKDCKAHYTNCRLDYAAWDQASRWDAVAIGEGGVYVEYNAESLEQAKTEAIAGCKRRTAKPDSCRLQWSSHSPEWLAIVESKTNSAYAVGKTRDMAISLAMKACQTEKKEECGDISTFENAGATEEPKALKRIKIDIEQEKNKVGRDASQSNPGVGKLLRYSESCRNADCVRRYQDGKTVRYTACLNPATHLPMSDPTQLGGCGGTDLHGNIFGIGSL